MQSQVVSSNKSLQTGRWKALLCRTGCEESAEGHMSNLTRTHSFCARMKRTPMGASTATTATNGRLANSCNFSLLIRSVVT